MNLENQIKEILRKTDKKYIKVAWLLSKVDFSEFLGKDSNSKFPLVSVIRLHIFKLIKGIRTFYELVDYLNKNKSEGFLLGFYLDYKNELLLPSKRTFNFILQTKANKEQLKLLAEEILFNATKNEIVLDIEIVKKLIKEKKENHDREDREAVKLIKKLVYPQVNLKIKENGKFTTKDLLDVLVHIAFTHEFTNNGSLIFKEMNSERQTPSGDLMMYHFSKFTSITQLRTMFERILDVIFNFAKKNYNILQRRKLDIAYDIHKICYYGKNISYICGGKHERGTTNFFEFLTCSIVVAGRRFILDVVPVHPFDSLQNLLDSSLKRVKNKIRVDKAYFDRGFNGSEIVKVLKKNKIKFVMPFNKRHIQNYFDKDIENLCDVQIFENFVIAKKNPNEKVNLILVKNKLGVKYPFICNFDLAPCLCFHLFDWYGRRWGIETGYRNLEHDFKPKTTTKNYHIRLFYFLFSVCLYNLWVLVNICISLAIYGRIKNKPIITAKMFAVLLYKAQIEYFDNGG